MSTDKPHPLDADAQTLVLQVARRALEAHLSGTEFSPPETPQPLPIPEGLFVTLRTPTDDLRGCIGHIGRTEQPLLRSVVECAVSAATRDPRFTPVERAELEGLRLEISLLGPLEPVSDLGTLDAKRYGVVCSSGWRRGVLLPDIEGVDSVEEQLEIACRKAGIDPAASYQVHRFQVFKVAEPAAEMQPAPA